MILPNPSESMGKPFDFGNRTISLKQTSGLSSLICLLPVADRLHSDGAAVNLITRPEWAGDLSVLRPNFYWNGDPDGDPLIDLDQLSGDDQLGEHRTDQFGRLIGQPGPFPSFGLVIPDQWKQPFERFRGCVVFAPESGYSWRQWPADLAKDLAYHLASKWVILTGVDAKTEIVCDEDFREKLQLRDLIGLLSVAETVITMNSAVLHLAAALAVPTVAIFGGDDPDCRVRHDQQVVVLQTGWCSWR